MILFDGRDRDNWRSTFHGRSEAAQLAINFSAFTYSVAPGDEWAVAPGSERAELYRNDPAPCFARGQEVWWGWDTVFKSGFVPSRSFDIFTQFHQEEDAGSPNIDFRVTPQWLLECRRRGGDPAAPVSVSVPIAPFVTGKWFRFVLRIRWHWDDLGLIEGWCDGKQFLNAPAWPTLYEDQSVYVKQGLYRMPFEKTCSVTHRRMVCADKLSEVLAVLG